MRVGALPLGNFESCNISEVLDEPEDHSGFIDFDELQQDSVDKFSCQVDYLYSFVSESTSSEDNRLHMALEDYRSHELRRGTLQSDTKIPTLSLEFVENYAVSTEASERKPFYDGLVSPSSNDDARQIEAMASVIDAAICSYTKDLELDWERSIPQTYQNTQLQLTLMRLIEEQRSLNQDLRQVLQEVRYFSRRQRQEAVSIVPAYASNAKSDLRRTNTERANTKDMSIEVLKTLADIVKLPVKSAEMLELRDRLKELAKTSDNEYKLRILINRIRTLMSRERTNKAIHDSTRQTMNVTSKLCAMDSSLDRTSISINTSIVRNSSFESDYGEKSLSRQQTPTSRDPFGSAKRFVNVNLE